MSCCDSGSSRPSFCFGSPAKAVRAMLAEVSPVLTEQIPLERAAGRVLAAAIVADRPSPALDVSAMDGYAVLAADTGPAPIPVLGEAWIGRAPASAAVPVGIAVRIVTGAPLPPGTDCVIKREDVEERPRSISLPAESLALVRPGAHVRRRGENTEAGQVVVRVGDELAAGSIAAAASFGATELEVHRPVRVAVIVTGDELVDASAKPEPWQLRDSNGPALVALLSRRPWLQALPIQRAADDPEQLASALGAAASAADAILLTGGASMGHRDFVPAAVTSLGARTIFHKLPQRPGKPILGAVLPNGRPILGLPGNPVSVLVTARRFAVPILCAMAGLKRPDHEDVLVRVDGGHESLPDLWWHRLVRRTAAGQAVPISGKGSGDVVAAAASDGFVEIPPGASSETAWPMYNWMW